MSTHLRRGQLLMEHGRFDSAETELRAHLAQEPHDAEAHARLATCLIELGRLDEAERSAKTAIGICPDDAYPHVALASVLIRRRRLGPALVAVEEALRIDPHRLGAHILKAGILAEQERWPPALEAADAGLSCDPKNTYLLNIRAESLQRLGRPAEAERVLASALAEAPDDPLAHVGRGMTLLRQSRAREATIHFREALRLDPQCEPARGGLVESLKAHNPVYAAVLRFFLWMQRLSPRARWGVILGGMLGVQVLRQLGRTNSAFAPAATLLVIAYGVFVLMTWLSIPLFNLALRFHPLGKHALDADQRAGANVFAALIVVGIALGTLGWLLSSNALVWLGVLAGALTLPASRIHSLPPGWPRRTLGGVVAVIAGLGLLAAAASWFTQDGAVVAGILCFVVWIASLLLVNVLMGINSQG